ncbi:hypothetical protein M947_05565 [Sulfurimonas hongkongensis]|uniref:Uncharacterized protein n=1 Tax=Sulfurimonas hongkongensis TaxID=1172190 RepID=T0JMS1_9BACT|nr:hypothetical protein [Sulfurimonas hongkongensis]EQB39461.1 hypothetical protein M947_05565 [Sulfurimonas hongkongensis]
MKEILKRYSMAIIFLFLVIVLMIAGTMGVMKFGDKMIKDTGLKMKPRGESINR